MNFLNVFMSFVEKHPQLDMAYVQSNSSVFTWEKIFSKIDSVYTDLYRETML